MGGIWKGAFAGAAAGAIANVALYFVASAAGVDMVADFMPARVPLPLGAVVVSSFVPAIGASLAAMLMDRFTKRGVLVFSVVAALFLAISMIPPLTLPGATLGLKLVLCVMHVFSGVAIPIGILRMGRPPSA